MLATTNLQLRQLSYEVLRTLLRALSPTHCPTCGVDLHLSPSTNLPPRFEKARPEECEQFNVVARLDMSASLEEMTAHVAAGVDQIVERIVESKATKCAELPLYGEPGRCEYRVGDIHSGLWITLTGMPDPEAGMTLLRIAIAIA